MSDFKEYSLMKGGEDVKRNTPLLLIGLLLCVAFTFSPFITKADTETDAGVGFFGEYPEQPVEQVIDSPLDVLPQTGDRSPLLIILSGFVCIAIAIVLFIRLKQPKSKVK
ncbi:LPXTG cell wall anchor domain-containing protein [Shouchella sp. JSM 1781072]|uniref:LPXTG cell wall anchor domain-containing protein n=1 Tax=Shouchella sp. JSM 1781072 TaxID=3344581 RepID=UPI0035BF80A3